MPEFTEDERKEAIALGVSIATAWLKVVSILAVGGADPPAELIQIGQTLQGHELDSRNFVKKLVKDYIDD